EMDLLSIPSNAGSLRLVQWPLFLLSNPVGGRFGFGLQRYTGRSVEQDM
ncbi:callose synthase 10-like, partial [Trifolium medium]|nr:callose synthase 10-like [Trifolium medium]